MRARTNARFMVTALILGGFVWPLLMCESSSAQSSSYTPGTGLHLGNVHKSYSEESSESSAASSSPVQQPRTVPTQSQAQTSQPQPSQAQPLQSQPLQSQQTPPQPLQSQPTPPQQIQQTPPPQDSQSQQAPHQHHGGGFLRNLGHALSQPNNNNSGNNSQQWGNVGAPNTANSSQGLPVGALQRNFSGKPTMVNGVPYTGGALPPSQGQAPKMRMNSMQDNFPIAIGKDDLDTFDNREMAKRANGGWVQRHYRVGTEGGGMIGKHGPAWH